MKIIPAILPKRYYDIEKAVAVVEGAASTVQIDFVDGFLAPNRTWWFNRKDEEILGEFEREERGLPNWENINYEFDLMVRDPLQHIDTFVMLGPSKIIFHLESFKQEEMLEYFQTLPEIVRSTIQFGIAIGIGTPPEDIAPYLPYVTTIQCMGIAAIGYQGQTFDDRVLEQIQKVKSLYPDKVIAVDGAVSTANIADLTSAGATQFIVGSSIFQNADPHGTIRMLKHLCKTAAPLAPEN